MRIDCSRGKRTALSATEIKRFAILPRDFSMDEGERTPTLKLKRRVCEEHFAAEIEALYS
jgi:long-chain acyl-CoA synthetase